MQMDGRLVRERVSDRTLVYRAALYNAEGFIAKRLLLFTAADPDLTKARYQSEKEIEDRIAETERETGRRLAAMQKKAVHDAMKYDILIITGGPGTGKTTTINTIIRLFSQEDLIIELCAPTGRAAKKMTEATGMEAKTIHRMLVTVNSGMWGEDTQRFEKNEDNPVEADVIIVDECSMIDMMLMFHLLKAAAEGAKLILVGDVDQLPSVGAGNVLDDCIQSGCVPVVRLTEVFRQAQESAIIMNAHRINAGEKPVYNGQDSDFFLMPRFSYEEVLDTVAALVTKRLPDFLRCDRLFDIQVLTPMRKSPLGVENLNKVLQNALNPPAPDKKEKEFRFVVFREGDKVMQIKNNYNQTYQILDAKGRVTAAASDTFTMPAAPTTISGNAATATTAATLATARTIAVSG
jgi:exodeoxyribonuclease V alpha subunit